MEERKKLIFLKAFSLNLITELTQPTTDDLLVNKVYTTHPGDLLSFE